MVFAPRPHPHLQDGLWTPTKKVSAEDVLHMTNRVEHFRFNHVFARDGLQQAPRSERNVVNKTFMFSVFSWALLVYVITGDSVRPVHGQVDPGLRGCTGRCPCFVPSFYCLAGWPYLVCSRLALSCIILTCRTQPQPCALGLQPRPPPPPQRRHQASPRRVPPWLSASPRSCRPPASATAPRTSSSATSSLLAFSTSTS